MSQTNKYRSSQVLDIRFGLLGHHAIFPQALLTIRSWVGRMAVRISHIVKFPAELLVATVSE